MDSCDYDSLCDEIDKVLADDDEAMLEAKQRIINYVCHIDLRADWFLNKVDLNQFEYDAYSNSCLHGTHSLCTLGLYSLELIFNMPFS